MKSILKSNKKGGSGLIWTVVIVAIAVLAIMIYVAFIKAPVQNTAFPGSNSNPGNPATQTNQFLNPSLSYTIVVDGLTNATISANPVNFKNVANGQLLGAGYAGVTGDIVSPLLNATGYIAAVQPQVTIKGGNQQIPGTLYSFQNETIQLYNNAQTGLVGGILGATGNDTLFSSQANNKIVLTGNQYKSTGRMFVVWELSTTANVTSAALSIPGASVTPISSIPNCYTNVLSGTPFRQAWEITTPILGVNQQSGVINTVAANSNSVQGQAILTIYNEKDAVDTGNAQFLQSGICDSKNVQYAQSSQTTRFYFN